MNQGVKKLWVKALRSGKYKQTVRRLRRDRKGNVRMCCLGVLCEVFRKTEKRGQWVHGRNGWAFMVDGSRATTITHEAVVEWAALPDDNPILGENAAISYTAAQLNDHGKDFAFIADRIERYL